MKTRRLSGTEVKLALTIALVYGAFARPFAGASSWAPVELARSVASFGDLQIDEVLIADGVLDPKLRGPSGAFPKPTDTEVAYRPLLWLDLAWRDGHFYPGTAPGLAAPVLLPQAIFERVLRAPLSAAIKDPQAVRGLNGVWLVWFAIIPAAVVTALLVHRTNVRLLGETPLALAMSLTWAFGSLAFFWGASMAPWQFILLAYWAILYFGFVRETAPTPGCLLALGAAASAACWFNYLAGAAAPLFGALIFLRAGRDASKASRGFEPRAAFRAAVPFILGGVLGALPLLAYHWAVFGHPLSTPYAHRVDASIAELMTSGVQGFLLPSPRLILQLLVGPRVGLLLYMPIAILLAWAWRARADRGLLLAAATGGLLFLLLNAARHHDWHAGEGFFGPRYLVPALPFLWLGIVLGAREAPTRVVQVAIIGAWFIGWIGAQYGQNPLHVALGQFFVRGPGFPVLSFAADFLTAHTTRRPPVSGMGIALTLALALWLVWRWERPLPFAAR